MLGGEEPRTSPELVEITAEQAEETIASSSHFQLEAIDSDSAVSSQHRPRPAISMSQPETVTLEVRKAGQLRHNRTGVSGERGASGHRATWYVDRGPPYHCRHHAVKIPTNTNRVAFPLHTHVCARAHPYLGGILWQLQVLSKGGRQREGGREREGGGRERESKH